MENIADPTVSIKKEIAVLTADTEFVSCENRKEYELVIKQEDKAVAFKKQVEAYWNGTDDAPGPIPKAYSLWKDLTTKRAQMLKPLETFIAACKRAEGTFLAIEAQKAKEQAVALEKQAKEMGLDASMLPQTDIKPQIAEGRALVQTWTYKVVDESLVPRKYLILNEKAIKAEVQAFKDKCQIPGIEAVMETTTRRTGK